MWEVGLILAASLAIQPQAATLEGCEFVNERWVCRYRLPEIQLLTTPPTSPEVLPLPLAAPPPQSPDPGVLSETETELVARCAEPGWFSLCLPPQRAEARRLRDTARAYEDTRRQVGELISTGACDQARARALGGGYLGLAREAQTLCAPASVGDQ